MDKPDVDHIEGLSPAISIDQKTTSRNPRSTVATVTEIYDYLRLLFARVGEPHCPICGRPIAGQSVEQITDQVLALPEGTRFLVLAPLVRGRKGEHRDVLEQIRAEGFTRVAVDGTDLRARRGAAARQEVQPHHRGGRRPARDERRPAPAPQRQPRDGDAHGRRPRADRGGAARRLGAARRGPTPRSSPAPSTAPRCPSWRRAPSRSTRPTAPARSAPASASRRRSTRSWWSTASARSTRARSCRGPTAPPTTTTCCSGSIATQHEIDLDTPWKDLPAGPADAAARRPAPPRARLPRRRPAQGRQLGLVRGRHPAAAAPAHHLDVAGGARQRRAVHVAAALPGLRRARG